jgi:oligoribonuclease
VTTPQADSEQLDLPLVWIDLEMTGLDPDRERIVEIAVIITDGQLERLEEGPDLVIGVAEEVLAAMDPFVVQMHGGSGLIDKIRASDLTVEQAEEQVLAFVRRHVPEPGTAPLAGNSVHADRAFLRKYMPRIESYVHYRNVDVSTVKELARRWHPQALERAPRKAGGHRALADIRESIEEMRYWRSAVFVSADGAQPATEAADAADAEAADQT